MQLDRVGGRGGGDVESVALVVLSREVGQQRRQGHVAVDGLELRDGLDEDVRPDTSKTLPATRAREGIRPAAGGEQDVGRPTGRR